MQLSQIRLTFTTEHDFSEAELDAICEHLEEILDDVEDMADERLRSLIQSQSDLAGKIKLSRS